MSSCPSAMTYYPSPAKRCQLYFPELYAFFNPSILNPKLATYPSVWYYQKIVIVPVIPMKGSTMFSDWRYVVSAILFLGSGFLFLYANSLWGLVPAYMVSLPVFAVGIILVVWVTWKTK